ncbi:MAG TPA: hypothetical protein VJN02_10145 [Gammaproteobacteria bacterium]|nr:hypothetical protein [Gammaproteobacteria bacterium]
MITQSCNSFIFNMVTHIKSLYGHFWSTPNGLYEYYLKLDGYYYCEQQKCMMTIIRIRNKRTIEKIPLHEIVNDKNYLKELHPLDTCTIGILANNERNGVINKNNIGWKKMIRSKECHCFVKADAILEISGKYLNSQGLEMAKLHSRILHKEIEVPVLELCKNQALLYALGSIQAISLGYDVSESIIRKQ